MQRLSSIHRALAQPLHRLLPTWRYSIGNRGYGTDDHVKTPRRTRPSVRAGAGEKEESDGIFHEDNIRNLSRSDVARLRIIYGLVKEHLEAGKNKAGAVEVESNPLLDPRSFSIKTVPELPGGVLDQFRKELPADVAAVSRPVSTHGVWDALQSGDMDNDMKGELQGGNEGEWLAVDERTMEERDYMRMRRQSSSHGGNVGFKTDMMDYLRKNNKKACALKDAEGKVEVDYRSVGLLKTFVSENGRILPKRKSRLSAKAQRKVAKAVKSARHMALIDPDPNPMPTYEELLELERNLP